MIYRFVFVVIIFVEFDLPCDKVRATQVEDSFPSKWSTTLKNHSLSKSSDFWSWSFGSTFFRRGSSVLIEFSSDDPWNTLLSN